MTISTSVWSAQHPNAGRNMQQRRMDSFKLTKKYLIATILQQWMDELIFAEARCVQQLKKKILNIEKFQKGHRKIKRKKKK